VLQQGAVMILPAGANKAPVLLAALKDLQLSAHNVVESATQRMIMPSFRFANVLSRSQCAALDREPRRLLTGANHALASCNSFGNSRR